MKRSTAQWTISLPPALSKEAQRVAEAESRTKSELVREALRRYLEQRSFERAQAKITQRFQRLGIRTEADIERLVDEERT